MSTVPLATENDTRAFGRALAAAARPGDVIALTGDLGAGKTRVSQGFAEGLGCAVEASSPTFPLVHEYAGGRLMMYHFDFYRLDTPEQVTALGWDEYLDAGGVCVVEWADKFPELLPPSTQWWRLTVRPDGTREAVGP